MNKILKENSVLIAGILLPVIMMIIFGIATVIPKYLVTPPKYDLLFMTGYNEFNHAQLKFNVAQGKLTVQLVCDKFCNSDSNNSLGIQSKPTLYIFEVKSQKTREININFPIIPTDSKSYAIEIKIPELDNLKIDTSIESPDGYIYHYNNDNSGLISELFFRDNTRQPVISKNSYSIAITPTAKSDSYYNIKFIGWIISKQGK